eukprot:scaffold95419_cov19-Tisochrysis_lutea.AAC.1
MSGSEESPASASAAAAEGALVELPKDCCFARGRRCPPCAGAHLMALAAFGSTRARVSNEKGPRSEITQVRLVHALVGITPLKAGHPFRQHPRSGEQTNIMQAQMLSCLAIKMTNLYIQVW